MVQFHILRKDSATAGVRVGSILVLVWVPGQLDSLLGDLDSGVAQLGQLRPHATELVPEAGVLQDSSYGSSIPAHLVYVRVEKLLIYSPLDLRITLS